MPRVLALTLLAGCQPVAGPHPLAEGHVGVTQRGAAPPVTASFTSSTTVLSGPTSGYAVGADVNGDGYRDVVVTRAGTAWVFRGSASGLSSTAAQTFTAPTAGGARLFYAGDVDRDGDEEVLFTRYQASSGRGAAWLCRGTSTGLSTTCRQVATGASTTTGLGVGAAAGDLSGDGYDDLAIAANDGTVAILRGGTGAGRPAAWTSLTHAGTPTGFDIAIGNFNGDRFDDLAVGRWHDDGEEGVVYVHFGAATPSFSTQTLYHPWAGFSGYCGSAASLGYSLGVPGDVDGDGRDELFAGAPYDLDLCGGGYGYLYYGGASGLVTTSWSEWHGASTETYGFLAPGRGDYNGDGNADVVVGSAELGASYAEATGFVRSDSGTETIVSVQTVADLGVTSAPLFASVGDVNGDGYDDVLATTVNGTGTRMELLYGAPTDGDGDGVSEPDDCDDTDPTVYPGAPDTCGDHVDSNCDSYEDECDSSALTAVVGGFAEMYSIRFPFVATEDLTADGVPDLLVGRPVEGELQILGGPVSPGMSSTPRKRFTEMGSNSYFGTTVLAPDLDGDGGAEIVTTAPDADVTASGSGSVYVFDGSFSGSATRTAFTADAEISGIAANTGLGQTLVAPGDLTGDGVADLLTSASGYAVFSSWYVFAGPFTADSSTASAAFKVSSDVDDGSVVAVGEVGDVDGDGQEDLLLGHRDGLGSGVVLLFHGPVAGVADYTDADVQVGENGGYDLGQLVTGVGDVNGDGLPDVATTDSQGTWLLTDLASPSSTLGAAWASFAGVGPHTIQGSVVPADLDGDGVMDLVVGDSYGAQGGILRAWAGPLAGAHDGADTLGGWRGQDTYPRFGYEVVNAGDLDGDGRDDLYTEEIATPSYPAGVIWLVPGSLF